MEDRYIEESVIALLEDLKNKIDDLTEQSEGCEGQLGSRVNAVIDKVAGVFEDVSKKLTDLLVQDGDREDTIRAIDTVREKSRQLYENALSRIGELKKEEEIPEEDVSTVPAGEEDAGAGGLEKENEDASDIADKTLEILKGWLTPEGEDQ